jgi:hypothetical protein
MIRCPDLCPMMRQVHGIHHARNIQLSTSGPKSGLGISSSGQCNGRQPHSVGRGCSAAACQHDVDHSRLGFNVCFHTADSRHSLGNITKSGSLERSEPWPWIHLKMAEEMSSERVNMSGSVSTQRDSISRKNTVDSDWPHNLSSNRLIGGACWSREVIHYA